MEVRRLAAKDPRCKAFIEMLNDYGLIIDQNALRKLLNSAKLVQDETPRAINDRREYYRTVYLKTDHWKQLKRRKLKAVLECEFCGTERTLDVHHRTYRSLYDVELTDLAVLCRKCHDSLHSSIDKHLYGDQKEEALDKIFAQRCRVAPTSRVKPVVSVAPIIPGTASARRRFEPDAPPSMGSFELCWTNRDENTRQISCSISQTNGERVGHPTQKPLKVILWCMNFCPSAQTILDPFMGSGTTCRAAKDLGRKAIGIEISEAYCEIAAKRMAQEVFTFA